jgi:hypothetical protein
VRNWRNTFSGTRTGGRFGGVRCGRLNTNYTFPHPSC